MKVLMINVVCGIRSTGRICTDLATELEKQGHVVKIAYGREQVPQRFQKYAVRIGSDFDVKLHGIKARVLDAAGFGSKRATEKFIKWVTGHCAYFDYVNCSKWKTRCKNCSQKTEYPSRIGPDRSKQNYLLKKELFTGIKKMVLVTPSQWLAGLISESYMREYPTAVIYNGIDTQTFKPMKSGVKERYGCRDKKIVLGVAAVWDKRKGLGSFIELAKHLDCSYQIILVGVSQKQIEKLPPNIIGIERTNSVEELAELYTAADVFVNPTLEDNYPTTNIEAIACGTPVITYETGGSPESAKMYGVSVHKKNIAGLVKAITNISKIKPGEIDIDYKSTVQKYIELYEEI